VIPLRRSLTARMVALAVLLALVVGGAITTLVLTIGDLRDTTRLSARSRELLVSANRAEKLILDLQTGTRGFRLTRDERFLESWRAGRLLLRGRTERMTSLAVDDPALTSLAEQHAPGERAYLDEH